MKIFFHVFVCCMFLFSTFAIAGNEGIYFCTKDLDAMKAVSVENENNLGTSHFAVHNNLNNPYNTGLRHCFIVHATKIGEDKTSLYLKVENALGYGSPDFALRAKTGGVYPEPIIKNATVSCVPVFEESDLKGQEEEIFDVWMKAYSSMYKKSKKFEYNTIGHNCCTVAYKAIKDIGGHLERINEKSFNMRGMGIVWGQTFSNIAGIFSSSSSSFPVIVEASKKMFSSSAGSSSPEETKTDAEKPTNNGEIPTANGAVDDAKRPPNHIKIDCEPPRQEVALAN